jgi:thiosulfate/3-mercaptopyruvate sulfurtransferase
MIDPIVSTDWLEKNLDREKLVIIDIRSEAEYGAGHIPNAINVPFEVPVSEWIIVRDDLLLELPEEPALFHMIGSLGIDSDSLVVIVTTMADPPDPPYPLANATRAADTLIYAGVKRVAILDGGHPKWVKENRKITTEIPEVIPVAYRGEVNQTMFASTEYVQTHIGKALIIDARDPDVYFGGSIEPFANKAGHIPSATCLPAPWMWNPDGTYKDRETLSAMASGVVGRHKGEEIIAYCGVGGYSSSWWFVLTEVLGYGNVKIYDGSAQEWVRYYDMVPYQWD